jgi:hypothetical protein
MKEELRISRRGFIAAGAWSLSTAAQDRPPAPSLVWHDIRRTGVEGKGWDDTLRFFDRFPSRAEKLVRPPVWNLSRHSAGMLVRFETDAKEVHARWSLLSANLAMPHMPATGVSGVDLYAQDAAGADRWLAVGKPTQQKMEARLAGGIDPLPGSKPRRYTLYLPLYNGTESLEIGVPEGASFTALPPRKDPPLVFYGTSIMHGACASRTGLATPAILGRRFGKPTINLGFSGSGTLDPEIADLMGELEAAVFVLDCLPNLDAVRTAERAAPFVRRLRKRRPSTPILMVEDRSFASAPLLAERRAHHEGNRAAFRRAFEELTSEGVKGLHYLPGEGLIGVDGEGTTDGSHPNDLGFVRYADAYEPALRKALEP